MTKLCLLLAVASMTWAQQPGATNVTVSFSATPTFTTTALITNFDLTLTGNVTSSSFSSAAIGMATFNICENSSGGFTVTWPGSFVGFPAVNTNANACTFIIAKYDGTNVKAVNFASYYPGLSIASGKTFTVSNTLTLNGTDNTTLTGPSTSGTLIASNDTGTVNTGMIATNAVTSAKMAVANTRHTCDIPVGDTSASALTNAQLGPQSRVCFIPYAATIVEMDVNADAGTPNVIVGRNHAGTVTNIVSSALATASSGGIACSNTGGTTGLNGSTTCSSTLQNTSLSVGDYLELVSGTAGGTAKFFVVHVIYTIN